MNNKKKVAIFDIDGTIFRKNLHFELIDELAWMGVFPKTVRKKLTMVYANWLEHKGTYETYRDAIIELYAKHIKGCNVKDVRVASQSIVAFHKDRTYIFSEDMIKKFKKEGYHIIAISGSPIEIVEEFNSRRLRFDKVFGSVYELDKAGNYSGRAIFEPPKDKGNIIKRYIYENKLSLKESYGIGDTESDASFLELVENPIAFNPNQNLKNIAQKRKWSIIVEKKDVIYEIK